MFTYIKWDTSSIFTNFNELREFLLSQKQT